MYHFRNGKEFSFKVTELKFPGFGIPLDTHVHETFGTPVIEKKVFTLTLGYFKESNLLEGFFFQKVISITLKNLNFAKKYGI